MGNIITDLKDLKYAWKHRAESKIHARGDVWTEHRRNGRIIESVYEGENTFTTEGMTAILDIIFRAQTTYAAVYCGIFKGNVTPLLSDTAAAGLGAAGRLDECLDAEYDDPATNRPAYTIAAAAASVCTNTASKAEYVMVGDVTVYGAFLATSQAKTAATGALLCGKRFTAAKVCADNDELAVTYAITLSTS